MCLSGFTVRIEDENKVSTLHLFTQKRDYHIRTSQPVFVEGISLLILLDSWFKTCSLIT
jgi:hypothetical protein